MSDAMVPHLFRVSKRIQETADIVTLHIVSDDKSVECDFKPGQFNMLYAFGQGESAISISGTCSDTRQIVHTIRAVGNVTNALCALQVGELVGVRGPFGTSWPMEVVAKKSLLFIAGGIGLAPLRPALYYAAEHRHEFKNIYVLAGARSPDDLLFMDEMSHWKISSGFTTEVAVDHANTTWKGHVGVVPSLLKKINFDPLSTVVMMCGPEIMMRFTVDELCARGLPKSNIYATMERNMKCAIGLCGHCQFGPHFICKDGPVFSYEKIESLFRKREV